MGGNESLTWCSWRLSRWRWCIRWEMLHSSFLFLFLFLSDCPSFWFMVFSSFALCVSSSAPSVFVFLVLISLCFLCLVGRINYLLKGIVEVPLLKLWRKALKCLWFLPLSLFLHSSSFFFSSLFSSFFGGFSSGFYKTRTLVVPQHISSLLEGG